MANNATVAACRAALDKACRYVGPGDVVSLDDAAVCMAEREAKLRGALAGLLDAEAEATAVYKTSSVERAAVIRLAQARYAARKALAAAQEKP